MIDLAALDQEELDELRYLWLSRLMFNSFAGWAPETRSFEEYVNAVLADRGPERDKS